jgi:hypothetical protein
MIFAKWPKKSTENKFISLQGLLICHFNFAVVGEAFKLSGIVYEATKLFRKLPSFAVSIRYNRAHFCIKL